MCSGENTKGWAGQSFDKRIIRCDINPISHLTWKAAGQKGMDMEKVKDFKGQNRATWLQVWIILQEKKNVTSKISKAATATLGPQDMSPGGKIVSWVS